MITKLAELIEAAKKASKKRLVVAYAADIHTIEAAERAIDAKIVEATLVGDQEIIRSLCLQHGIDCGKFTIVDEKSDVRAAARAVELAAAGHADIIMKGTITTDKYMHAILSKEAGLLPPKAIVTHVTVLEIPAYHKLLTVSDIAIIPQPDINQKVCMTREVISTAHTLGVENPKVAIIAPTEMMLTGLPSCVDAGTIAKMGDRGQISGAIIDGPLAVDVAIDGEAAVLKKLTSPVVGDADCMVFPDLDASNSFFKAATKLAHASLAGLVVGAKVPCVLTSRGDSEDSKLNSIALAVIAAEAKKR